jgi:pimeloyl-ACP methyl ester carboxylesterase
MRLPHDDVGAGAPVILLHAGIADRTMWAEHLGPLAATGRRVIAPDLPGFGEAPVAPRLEPWVDVLETLDALGVERAALVGNSFGGAVALSLAAAAPARVAALALISAPPPGLDPSPQLRAIWEAEESAVERGDLEAAVRAVVDAWTLPDAPFALRERVAAMQRRALELQTTAAEPDEVADPAEARPEALAELRIPALAAAGEHDLPDFVHGAEQLARRLPGARHAVLAGAGHLAPLETPEAFRALLLGFLDGAG